MKPDSLKFPPNFSRELDHRGHQLRLGVITPRNREQISRGLKLLSSASIRNRFMGSKKEFSEKELHYLTQLDGHHHFALGIEERGPHGKGVAVARMVRSASEPQEAEVAITIIDEYQKMGLGSLLLRLLVLAASERDITRLSFTYLKNNEGIARLIHQLGKPTKYERSEDTIQAQLELSQLNLEQIKQELGILKI